MRVLGVDPGTFKMGVGVVEYLRSEYRVVHFTVLNAPRSKGLPHRLHILFNQLSDIVDIWKPTELAIEEPFAGRNIRASMAIGHAQALAMLIASITGIEVSTYAPRSVKQAVTDYGGSSKEQVQDMVSILLNIAPGDLSSDAADALAVAICHINSSHAQQITMTE